MADDAPRTSVVGLMLDGIALLLSLSFWGSVTWMPLIIIGLGIYLAAQRGGKQGGMLTLGLVALVVIAFALLARWFSKGLVARKRGRILGSGFITLIFAALFSVSSVLTDKVEDKLQMVVYAVVSAIIAVTLFIGGVRRPT